MKPNSSALTGVLSTKQGWFSCRFPSVCAHSLFHVCSEGAVAVRRNWLQLTRDPAVHLGPEVSGHGSAGNHPREEHGHPAPTADQQVIPLRCCVTPLTSRTKQHEHCWLRAFSGFLEIGFQSWRRNFKHLKCQDYGVFRVSINIILPDFPGTSGAHVVLILIPYAFFFCPFASRSVEASLTMFQWE